MPGFSSGPPARATVGCRQALRGPAGRGQPSMRSYAIMIYGFVALTPVLRPVVVVYGVPFSVASCPSCGASAGLEGPGPALSTRARCGSCGGCMGPVPFGVEVALAAAVLLGVSTVPSALVPAYAWWAYLRRSSGLRRRGRAWVAEPADLPAGSWRVRAAGFRGRRSLIARRRGRRGCRAAVCREHAARPAWVRARRREARVELRSAARCRLACGRAETGGGILPVGTGEPHAAGDEAGALEHPPAGRPVPGARRRGSACPWSVDHGVMAPGSVPSAHDPMINKAGGSGGSYVVRQNGWPSGSVRTVQSLPPGWKSGFAAPSASTSLVAVSRSSTLRSRWACFAGSGQPGGR